MHFLEMLKLDKLMGMLHKLITHKLKSEIKDKLINKRTLPLLIVLTYFCLIQSCDVNYAQQKRNKNGVKNSLEVINKLKKELDKKNYEKVYKMFHPNFYQVTEKKELISLFKYREKKLGKHLQYKVIKWGVEKINNDIFHNYIIESSFSKKQVKQKISLIKQDSTFLISGYYFLLKK